MITKDKNCEILMDILNKRTADDYPSNLLSSFIYDDDISEKRFNRFVSKVETIVTKELNRGLYGDSTFDLSTRLRHLCVSTLLHLKDIDKLLDEAAPDISKKLSKRWICLLNTYGDGNDVLEIQEQPDRLDVIDKLLRGITTWSEIFDKSMRDVCIQWIHEQSLRNPKVTSDSFVVQALPSSRMECWLFIKLLYNHIYTSVMLRSAVYAMGKDNMTAATDLLRELESENNDLRKSRDELIASHREEMRVLNNQSDKRSDKIAYLESEVKRLQEHVTGLERLAGKRQKEIMRLTEKYDALKEEYDILADSVSEETIREETNVKFDYDARIVFIASAEEAGGVAQTYAKLRATFPNCKITDDINAITNADVVVFMGKYITHHSLYWIARKTAKQKGVKSLHCDSQNIDHIIRILQEHSRYGTV